MEYLWAPSQLLGSMSSRWLLEWLLSPGAECVDPGSLLPEESPGQGALPLGVVCWRSYLNVTKVPAIV